MLSIKPAVAGRPSLRAQVRHAAPAVRMCPMPAQRVAVRASAAGAAGGDPWQVLGLPAGSDYNAIQRAYRKRLADVRGKDEAEQQRIEAAHSSIMMSMLSSRLAGNVSVDRDVMYADKARYFPWRPRVYRADNQLIMYAGAAQLVCLAWALLSPLTAGTQPVIWSAIASAVTAIMKQNRINPPPERGMEMTDEEKKQTGKNLLRGFFLAFLATFGGCFLAYTLPDAVASQLGKVLPFWFYEGQTMLLAIGSCTCNFLFTALLR